jgi:voltage-gated potassium channel
MLTARRQDCRLNALAGIDLFRGCPTAELAAIARLVCPTRVAAGAVLCREGEYGRQAFVVVDGAAVVTVAGISIADAGPGDFFGEMAILDNGPRTATVTAVTPMELLVLSCSEFRGLLSEAPTVTRRMLVGFSSRLRLAQRVVVS